MGPRPHVLQTDKLPRPRLDEQIKMSHRLVRLSKQMKWKEIERSFGAHFTHGCNTSRAGPTPQPPRQGQRRSSATRVNPVTGNWREEHVFVLKQALAMYGQPGGVHRRVRCQARRFAGTAGPA